MKPIESPPPLVPLALARPRIRSTPLSAGGLLLESEEPLGEHPPHLGLLLERQAQERPEALFLAERRGPGWRTLRYGEAWAAARAVAQALLDRGLDQARPLLILSGNGIDHALVMLGGFLAGVPVAPVSVAYSQLSQHLGKLRHILDLVRPRLVFAADGTAFALAVRTLGRRVLLTSSWGSTETAPLATTAHFPTERAGVVGVPVSGTQLKLVPAGEKLELRVRGPNVTPGYLGPPELTREAFDEEGFYRIGDATRLVDEADPCRGLVFDGRTAEDFKLTTGTWVHVGALRVAALAACSPLLQDAVVTGADRSYVGLLAWPSAAALGMAPEQLRAELTARLGRYNAAQSGSSTAIRRLLLLNEPPSIDANEITDKGYINQRATLERRAVAVGAALRRAAGRRGGRARLSPGRALSGG